MRHRTTILKDIRAKVPPNVDYTVLLEDLREAGIWAQTKEARRILGQPADDAIEAIGKVIERYPRLKPLIIEFVQLSAREVRNAQKSD